ncbi:MAG: dioxygenase [Sphingomonadales bacterium]|nr:dioxygenase [Sphingomonadales bacterium]
MTTNHQPSFYIPHGGGPCFFMDDPAGTWTGMERFLRDLPSQLPAPPKAILVVSGHWETQGFRFTSAEKPTLLFDYYGFPEHTYRLRYDVPGSPELAGKAAQLLRDAPAGRFSHPREEHLIPLMVAAGASRHAGSTAFNQRVMQTAISGYRFD